VDHYPCLARVLIVSLAVAAPGLWPVLGDEAPALASPAIPKPVGARPEGTTKKPVAEQQPQAESPLSFVSWVPDLPDAGPRYVRPLEGPAASLFEQGLAAQSREAWAEAETFFNQALARDPSGPLADAAQAYLAERLVAEPGPGMVQRRQAAITAYRRIIRDFPRTANAARAYWRIGDLYVAMDMRAEGQASYEHATANLPAGADADRAWLGLAIAYAAEQRWREAARIFTQLHTQTADDVIRRYSTVGLADALHRDRQFAAAQPLYETVGQHWLDFLKGRPGSLLHAIENAKHTTREALTRRWSLQFYNLYPGAEQAPSALVDVADSFYREGARERATMFYAEAIVRYPDSPAAGLGRVRLAEMGFEDATSDHALQSAVKALFRDGPAPSLDTTERRKVLRAVADAGGDRRAGSEALFRLGEQHEALSEPTNAIAVYRELVAKEGRLQDDPWPALGWRRLAALLTPRLVAALKQGDDLQAITFFHPLWAADDRIFVDRGITLKMAAIYRRLGFTPEAVRLYQSLLQGSSDGAIREEALFYLGQTYLDQEDFAAARHVYDRYRLQYPLGRWKTDALLLLARAHQGLQNYDTVSTLCRRWLRLYPTHPDGQAVRLMLAHALVEEGHTEEALHVYAELEREGTMARPSEVTALVRYADVLYHARRYDDAVTRYRQALRAQPAPVQADWIRLQLARIWRAQAHRAAARGVLKELNGVTTDELIARLSASMQADLATGTTGGS